MTTVSAITFDNQTSHHRYYTLKALFHYFAIIPIQLLLENSLNFNLIFSAEVFPNGAVYFHNAKCFGVAQHIHIFKSFEWVRKNIAFSFLIGIATFGENTIFLFYHKSVLTEAFVKLTKIISQA